MVERRGSALGRESEERAHFWISGGSLIPSFGARVKGCFCAAASGLVVLGLRRGLGCRAWRGGGVVYLGRLSALAALGWELVGDADEVVVDVVHEVGGVDGWLEAWWSPPCETTASGHAGVLS